MGKVLSGSIAAITLLSCAHAAGQAVLIHGGFMTGNAYMSLSSNARHVYVMGVIDGMFFAPALGAPKTETQWIDGCASQMESKQVQAIVDKWTQDNPGQWHNPMHALVHNAMKAACKKD